MPARERQSACVCRVVSRHAARGEGAAVGRCCGRGRLEFGREFRRRDGPAGDETEAARGTEGLPAEQIPDEEPEKRGSDEEEEEQVRGENYYMEIVDEKGFVEGKEEDGASVSETVDLARMAIADVRETNNAKLPFDTHNRIERVTLTRCDADSCLEDAWISFSEAF